MHITRFLLIAIFLFSLVERTFGSKVDTRVDATNIKTLPFFVRAEKTHSGREMVFTVIAGRSLSSAIAGEGMDFSFQTATLSVYDGRHFISSCSVAGEKVPAGMEHVTPSFLQSGVLFEFTVSRNYLTSSKFEVWYVSGRHPAINAYTFMLKSFVDAK